MQLVKCGYFLPDMCAQGTKLRSKLSTLVLPWQFIQKKTKHMAMLQFASMRLPRHCAL